MLKKAIALILIILAIYWSFSALVPFSISDSETDKTAFSTERALEKLKQFTHKPHHVGSENHQEVRDFIVKELQALGLKTQIQEGYSITKWNVLTKPQNILARIEGSDNSKALMLLTHYDSRGDASLGASDAGSGVVTILEGLRAFLTEKKQPKNDIIVLISDAEELGLNGADLFVNKHPWAKDVGLVLNFEARGSGGPSHTLIETNGGNENLIEGFKEANPSHPVANSLSYSIYKMLPNDTDLTRFREDGNIDGFNFAFIDDHFDYHTSLDNYERLNQNSLEHQGSYLMPLLHYFSEANLNNIKSGEDEVYFNVPLFKTMSYSYGWIFPMLILAILLLVALVFYGINKRTLETNHILQSFLPGIGVLLVNGLVGYFGWMLLTALYPQYNEILQGFPYNGYLYIWAFGFFSLAVCMWFYNWVYKPENTASLAVPPLILWLIICTVIAFSLKGASFFIIPVFFGLISLWLLVRKKRPNIILLALLLFPVLMILSPFIKMFPVGLGMDAIIATTLLVSLIFSLCISVFGFSRYKDRWAYGLFIVSFCFFVYAHFKSDFNEDRPKPNSLVYVYDADQDKAHWATYDHLLDDWTRSYLGDDPKEPDSIFAQTFESKYGTRFTYSNTANIKPLKLPYIDKQKDSVAGNVRYVKLFINPQRKVDRMEIFADSTMEFLSVELNGLKVPKKEDESSVFGNRETNRLFSYVLTNDSYLEMEFSVPADQKTEFVLYESSSDMLNNPLFRVPQRPADMIAKPFILNDAVIVKKTIKLDETD